MSVSMMKVGGERIQMGHLWGQSVLRPWHYKIEDLFIEPNDWWEFGTVALPQAQKTLDTAELRRLLELPKLDELAQTYSPPPSAPKPVVKSSPFPDRVKAEHGFTILPKMALEFYTIRPSREFLKGNANMAPIQIEWAGQIRFVHELHIGNDGETTFRVHRGGCFGPQQNGVVQVTTASLAYR